MELGDYGFVVNEQVDAQASIRWGLTFTQADGENWTHDKAGDRHRPPQGIRQSAWSPNGDIPICQIQRSLKLKLLFAWSA